MAKRALGNLRAGRFNVNADTVLSVGTPGAAYRIFNTGDNDFTVAGIVLKPGSSVDVVVTGNLEILASADVSGIYEWIHPEAALRSGKIYSQEMGNPTVVLVDQRAEQLYRFFNSGRKPFQLSAPGGVTENLLPRRRESRSLDVYLPSGTGNQVTVSAMNVSENNPIEGIYDDLNARSQLQSGRFKIDATPGTQRKIIIVAATLTSVKMYRVLNAGDTIISIYNNGVKAHDLGPADSVDLGVNNATISVASGEMTPAPIKGIYEYLGDA